MFSILDSYFLCIYKMYNFKSIENKWKKVWKSKKLYQVNDKEADKKNFYQLTMFPYPSGDLHVGHWKNFAPPDVFVRYKRMQGYNILSPIGFDAFGLPAENAALKNGIHPEKWTLNNIKTMTKQLESMGNSYDWSKLIVTCLPEYYKWNQLFFIKLFNKGLAYRKKAPANWCPSCKTVLANEQVIDGKCERCDSVVIQKEIDQWLFKITDYAERLLAGLEKLDWPEQTKQMQKNWIGKSEGALIKFCVVGLDLGLEVFTTRPDTILGATYMVLAPEHELITKLKARIKNWQPVSKYIENAKLKSEKERIDEGREKTGIELTGLNVINPATKKVIPVWVSDYVVGSYGTGAIMAVPQHDERDREFAVKYELPIIDEPLLDENEAIKLVNGKKTQKYRLRDWLISRQRYWGTPIPIIYCKNCGIMTVSEDELPVKLPKLKDFKPADDGRSPLARDKKFLEVKCPKCKKIAERETDTMDTFVDSSWYFLRYPSSKFKQGPFQKETTESWLPVSMYNGGAEHTVLHLLYSRFFTKFLNDEGLIGFDEPFLALRHQGTILGPDGQKMSKSKGNVIDPDKLVSEFGADAVRLYIYFMGEYSQATTWDPNGILGVVRFLQRVYALKNRIEKAETSELNEGKYSQEKNSLKDDSLLIKKLHKTIKKVGEDIELMKFNTAVSALMILLNDIEKEKTISLDIFEAFIKLLAPFAPYLSEELFQEVLKLDSEKKNSQTRSIHFEYWPKYNQKFIKDETFELVIQVNGRVRDTISISADLTRDNIETLALKNNSVQKYLEGKKPDRIIYIPETLINFVISNGDSK